VAKIQFTSYKKYFSGSAARFQESDSIPEFASLNNIPFLN